ncbi:hypothetical protein KDU71_18445 [Carboxylicivirga sediminis]|uniref:Uncharacterized protein n=1 Tax=Carboxylicivirga sediminis TaxID=2006564 RepID=A0A941IY61_9BACT|nr:hypothetical protein [Carboxylicivirga sediminis]MBR8537556.1 hypothetical protein [Carboxylicivirga sediminis]
MGNSIFELKHCHLTLQQSTSTVKQLQLTVNKSTATLKQWQLTFKQFLSAVENTDPTVDITHLTFKNTQLTLTGTESAG